MTKLTRQPQGEPGLVRVRANTYRRTQFTVNDRCDFLIYSHKTSVDLSGHQYEQCHPRIASPLFSFLR